MCIVVDPPLFIPMFKNTDPKHADFIDLKNWICTGKGKLVYGGEEYQKQLNKLKCIHKFIAELRKMGKVVIMDNNEVNDAAEFALQKAASTDFDDAHLVAIVSVSKCRLVAVDDSRSHRFIKSKKLYLNSTKLPKLYTGVKNKSILIQRNIVQCCT